MPAQIFVYFAQKSLKKPSSHFVAQKNESRSLFEDADRAGAKVCSGQLVLCFHSTSRLFDASGNLKIQMLVN